MLQRWRALVGQLGFGERLLWVGFVGADRCMIKALLHVELGPRPRRRAVEATMAALPELLDGFGAGTTVALLLTRPGNGPISDADRQWATLLTEMAAEANVPIEPFFRANDEAMVLVAPSMTAQL